MQASPSCQFHFELKLSQVRLTDKRTHTETHDSLFLCDFRAHYIHEHGMLRVCLIKRDHLLLKTMK